MRIEVRDFPPNAATFAALLEGFVRLNQWMLTHHSQVPPLYQAGVRYQREDGTEIWKPAPRVFSDRFGDCEDLAAWRAAELRLAGEMDARAIAIRLRSGSRVWHAVVQRASGDIEDPSVILGMKAPT
jgi:hypothetical protein